MPDGHSSPASSGPLLPSVQQVSRVIPDAWVSYTQLLRSKKRLRPKREDGHRVEVTIITQNWLILATRLWEHIGEPPRVSLWFHPEGHLLLTGADHLALECVANGVALRLTKNKYLASLLRAGEYPGARAHKEHGVPGIMIPDCTYVKPERLEALREAMRKQRALATAARTAVPPTA